MEDVHVRNSKTIDGYINTVNYLNSRIDRLIKLKNEDLDKIKQLLPYSTYKDREWIHDFMIKEGAMK